MLSICTCRLRKHWRQPWRHAFPLFAVLRCRDLILYCILLYCIAWYCSEVTCFTFLQLWDPKMWYCNRRFVLPPQHDVVCWSDCHCQSIVFANSNPIQNNRSNILAWSLQNMMVSHRWKLGWLDFKFNGPSLEMLILEFTCFGHFTSSSMMLLTLQVVLAAIYFLIEQYNWQ